MLFEEPLDVVLTKTRCSSEQVIGQVASLNHTIDRHPVELKNPGKLRDGVKPWSSEVIRFLRDGPSNLLRVHRHVAPFEECFRVSLTYTRQL